MPQRERPPGDAQDRPGFEGEEYQLKYIMAQQQGGSGSFPQGGGAVDLVQQPFRYPVL